MTKAAFFRRLYLALAAAAMMITFANESAAAPPPAAAREIEHLLSYVATSGCEFYRNGFWYTAKEGAAHLRTKYDYFAGNDQIRAAEDFIDFAASKSSISGLAYKVRCPDQPEVGSTMWLNAELARYRARR